MGKCLILNFVIAWVNAAKQMPLQIGLIGPILSSNKLDASFNKIGVIVASLKSLKLTQGSRRAAKKF